MWDAGSSPVTSQFPSLWEIPVTTIDGISLERFGNAVNPDTFKAMLIVNVASEWGLTKKNYQQLVDLHNSFASDGLEIATFPSNQIGQ